MIASSIFYRQICIHSQFIEKFVQVSKVFANDGPLGISISFVFNKNFGKTGGVPNFLVF